MEPMLVSNSESSCFYLPSAEITGTSHYVEDSVLRRQRQTEFCELEARLVYMWSFSSGRAMASLVYIWCFRSGRAIE